MPIDAKYRNPVYLVPMDLQNIIQQLEGKLTQARIAQEAGCSQATISDIKLGKIGKVRPSWKLVTSLTSLAKKHGIRVQ